MRTVSRQLKKYNSSWMIRLYHQQISYQCHPLVLLHKWENHSYTCYDVLDQGFALSRWNMRKDKKKINLDIINTRYTLLLSTYSNKHTLNQSQFNSPRFVKCARRQQKQKLWFKLIEIRFIIQNFNLNKILKYVPTIPR